MLRNCLGTRERPLCPNLVERGRCEACGGNVKPWGPSAGQGSKHRNAALARQVKLEEPTCRLCGEPTAVADHIVPLNEGGEDVRDNLQGLCEACSGTKSGQEANRARRAGAAA